MGGRRVAVRQSIGGGAGLGDGAAHVACVGAARGVAGRFQLLPGGLSLLALQLELHLQLLQLRRRRARVQLPPRRAPDAGQLRQQLCRERAAGASQTPSGERSVADEPLLADTAEPTCYGIHGFPVAGRIGSALRRREPPSGAACKVHVGSACARTSQAPPRMEHPPDMPNAARFIVSTH